VSAEADHHREILPIPDRRYPGDVLYDAKDPDAKFPPIRPLRPPEGAPNVLLVLLDDVGFGASSAFGGPVHTPTAERLAGEASSTPASTPPRCARRRGRR
jgi:arylsulfatase